MNPKLIIPPVLAVLVALSWVSLTSASQAPAPSAGQSPASNHLRAPVDEQPLTDDNSGWAQMWEVNRECIVEKLGYMPEGLSDLPERDREKVLQSCGKIVDEPIIGSNEVGLVNAGFDQPQDSAPGTFIDLASTQEMETLDRYWRDKIDQLNVDWEQQLEALDEEYPNQDQYWSEEWGRKQQKWTSELGVIDSKIASLEKAWFAEEQEIRLKIDQERDPLEVTNLQRWLRAGRTEFEIQKKELEDWQFSVNHDMQVELEQLNNSWVEALDNIAVQRNRLDQIKNDEMARLEQEWANERARFENEFGTKGMQPPQQTPRESPSDSERKAPSLDYRVGDAPDIVEPVNATQRGFFFNRENASLNSATYGFQDPSILAVIGILATLVTAALTLVRGR